MCQLYMRYEISNCVKLCALKTWGCYVFFATIEMANNIFFSLFFSKYIIHF